MCKVVYGNIPRLKGMGRVIDLAIEEGLPVDADDILVGAMARDGVELGDARDSLLELCDRACEHLVRLLGFTLFRDGCVLWADCEEEECPRR